MPENAINWGPSNAIIELLGSRLVTNELFEDGLDEPSHNVEQEASMDELVPNEAIALG